MTDTPKTPKKGTVYRVLAKIVSDETLRVIGDYEAATPRGAVELAAEASAGNAPTGTVYVATPVSNIHEFTATRQEQVIYAVEPTKASPVAAAPALSTPQEAA